MRTLLLLAAMVAASTAVRYTYVGHNTNLDSSYTWHGGRMPVDQADGSHIIVENDYAIETTIGEGKTLHAGNGIKFVGEDIKIKFSRTGTTTIKFRETTGDDPARYFGTKGLNRHNDFNNKEVWQITNTGTDANLPPCHSDEAVFPAENTYAVFADRRVTVDEIVVGGVSINKKSNLPDNTFFIDNLHFTDETTDACQGTKYFDALESNCVCFTSFPEPEEEVDQFRFFRDNLKQLAEEWKQERAQEDTFDYSASFDYDLVGGQDLSGDMTDMMNDIAMHLAGMLDVDVSAITVDNLATATNRVTVGGTITTTAGKVMPIDTAMSAQDFLDDDNALVYGNVDSVDSKHVFLSALRNAVMEAFAMMAQKASDAAKDVCGSPCETLDELLNNPIVTDPAQLLSSVLACNSDPSCIDRAINDNVDSGASQEEKDALENQLSSVDLGAAGVSDYLAAKQAALTAPKPEPHTHSQFFIVGEELPPRDWYFILNVKNKQAFIDTITQTIPGSYGVTGISNVQAELNQQSVARRRSTDVNGIGVTFQYTRMCGPSESCEIGEGTDEYNGIEQALDNIAYGFTVTSDNCLSLNDVDFDIDCLKNLAQQYVDEAVADGESASDAVAAARNMIRNLVKCDSKGSDADGQCYEQRDSSDADSTTNTVMQSVSVPNEPGTTDNDDPENPGNPEGSSGGGDDMGVIIGGAVGGAVVLIIIIVLVLVFVVGVGSGGAAASTMGKSEDRTVVAFENPMYDDPVGQTDADAAYADAHAGEDAEGLYDEPAFNGDKSNPVYQSAENLVDAGADDNYLATEEDGGGYLDVAPENDDE